MKKIFMRSCEDPKTLYVCLGKKRYIFRNGRYVGWYRPNLDEVV